LRQLSPAEVGSAIWEENTMKTLRTIAAITALAGACFSFAAPSMAEIRNGEVVRIIVYPDGTTVY
jgi:hypothetical protein